MIENLRGLSETVNFKKDTGFRLYDNNEYEEYPDHWHTALEIIMPLKNTYTVTVESDPYTLEVGDILIISSGVIHSMAPIEGERIIFQPDYHLLHQIHEADAVLTILSPVRLITPKTDPDIYDELRSLIMDIKEEYFGTNFLSEAVIYEKMLHFFVLIGRKYYGNSTSFDVTRNKQKEYMEKFMSICNYINEHCTDNLTLEETARMAGFSKFHFTRLFKQFSGLSFYKYVNKKRIERAEQLLINPSISVTEAALQSGFSSLSAFIRMFKLMKGCTPTEFRDLYTR